MIDTHAHPLLCSIPHEHFFANAKLAGVTHIVGVATSIKMGLETLALSKKYPQLIPTIGIHPSEAKSQDQLSELPMLLSTYPEFKAIGEAGLDFYHDNGPLSLQQEVFEFQLKCARDATLPIIIHTRQADEEIKPILKKYEDVKKVIHCFSSKIDFVKATLNENTYYSFTGMVTYKNKAYTHEVIQYLPLEKLMIETDCPYLTPTAFAGKENQSAYVGEIAKIIADVKKLSLNEVIQHTTQTAKTFFKI